MQWVSFIHCICRPALNNFTIKTFPAQTKPSSYSESSKHLMVLNTTRKHPYTHGVKKPFMFVQQSKLLSFFSFFFFCGTQHFEGSSRKKCWRNKEGSVVESVAESVKMKNFLFDEQLSGFHFSSDEETEVRLPLAWNFSKTSLKRGSINVQIE